MGENPTHFTNIFIVIKHTGFMFIERSVSVGTQGFINEITTALATYTHEYVHMRKMFIRTEYFSWKHLSSPAA